MKKIISTLFLALGCCALSYAADPEGDPENAYETTGLESPVPQEEKVLSAQAASQDEVIASLFANPELRLLFSYGTDVFTSPLAPAERFPQPLQPYANVIQGLRKNLQKIAILQEKDAHLTELVAETGVDSKELEGSMEYKYLRKATAEMLEDVFALQEELSAIATLTPEQKQFLNSQLIKPLNELSGKYND